ncbi:MAG: hypothetical protein V4479_12175 [Actinomycetota bacterium]
MLRRTLRLLTASAVLIALAGCTAVAPSTSPTPTAGVTPAISPALAVAERLVAQEGLAIALASNVLQTQLLIVSDASDDSPTGCTALTGGGSHAVSGWGGSSDSRTLTETVYYDAACAQPYLSAQATAAQSGDDETLAATVAYTGTAGAALGSMTTNAHASFGGTGIALEGTGTFTRKGVGPVSLGLACTSQSDTVLDCQGGVSQDFPALKKAIGSVTPLTLTIGGDVSDPITFQGSGNSSAVSAPGTLSIASPDSANLALQGATAKSGAILTSGQAGGFVLFPPTPTGWTITDAAEDVSFTISVTDDTNRSLTGTVTRLSTRKSIATLAVDRSGTGTITYAGRKPLAVGSWMLTG